MRKAKQLAKPVAVDVHGELVWITLHDGRALGMPLALYPRLAQAQVQDLYPVAFLPDRVYWPDLGETIRLEEMRIVGTTREYGDRLTVLKRRVIILFDALESRLLRHRVAQVCHALGASSWWGDNWPQIIVQDGQR